MGQDPTESHGFDAEASAIATRPEARPSARIGARMSTLLLGCLLTALSCGYKVGGRADLLPKQIRTIAIPAWGNTTVRYKFAERLPAAMTREFLSRTRYQVVANPNEADAILNGTVISYTAYPTVFDQATGRAAAVQLIVNLQVRLTERATGKVLFDRPNFEARQRYEISVDPGAYFEESGLALERLTVEVARLVVSSILEGF